MLVIRAKQIRSFERAALHRFEEEMIAHSKEFSSRLCEVIGDEQLRVAVRSAMDRAMTCGFTNRGPVRLFIELMFLRGSAFDTDPQYPGLGNALHASDDQMQRAERMHEESLDYFEKVSGSGAVNVHNALRNLSIFAQMPVRFTANNFVTDMLQEMRNLFPEKVAYVGNDKLTTLIDAGRIEAQKYGFSTVRGEAMIVVLMFSFGHGCTNDPLYPWISRTLQDQRIIDPVARATRLEKKALTWLNHVVTRNEKRAQI